MVRWSAPRDCEYTCGELTISSIGHLERFAADCSGQQLFFLPRIVSDELKLIRLRVRASSSGRIQLISSLVMYVAQKNGALYCMSSTDPCTEFSQRLHEGPVRSALEKRQRGVDSREVKGFQTP